jgi:hypothetical protein
MPNQDAEFNPSLDSSNWLYTQELAGLFQANSALLRTAQCPDDGVERACRVRMLLLYRLQLAHDRCEI